MMRALYSMMADQGKKPSGKNQSRAGAGRGTKAYMTEPARGGADRPYPIRPIGPDEFDRFELVDQHGFHGGPMPEASRQRVLERFEYDRSLAAFDGDMLIGVTLIYSFQLSRSEEHTSELQSLRHLVCR